LPHFGHLAGIKVATFWQRCQPTRFARDRRQDRGIFWADYHPADYLEK